MRGKKKVCQCVITQFVTPRQTRVLCMQMLHCCTAEGQVAVWSAAQHNTTQAAHRGAANAGDDASLLYYSDGNSFTTTNDCSETKFKLYYCKSESLVIQSSFIYRLTVTRLFHKGQLCFERKLRQNAFHSVHLHPSVSSSSKVIYQPRFSQQPSYKMVRECREQELFQASCRGTVSPFYLFICV